MPYPRRAIAPVLIPVLVPILALVLLCARVPAQADRPKREATAGKPAQWARGPSRIVTGPWSARLECPGGELPFELAFEGKDGGLRATVHNGAERIRVPVTRLRGTQLTLSFDYYDSQIVAEVGAGGRTLRGTWTKVRGGGRRTRMAFRAHSGERPRFAPGAGGSPPAATSVAGRWRVQFEKDEHPAVGVFTAGIGHRVRGTFLTTLGDYRFLAGAQHGRRLALSCFDGAHAFLFEARLDAQGVMHGDFWSSDSWHETFTAHRDEKAALPDAWQLTRSGPAGLGRIRFPDLGGKLRALSDPAFRGKARVIVVFGSWCPNCRDETGYLVELDRRYRRKGLSIVGLAFEHTGDARRDTAQLRIYTRRQGIRFPVLLAGVSDKAKASQALPLLDRVRAYPTTLFLREDGSVRAVHTGFSGPATGAAHRELRAKFEAIIEELLE